MTEENKLKEAAVEKYHTMASIVTMDKEEFITAMINFSKSQAAREYWQKEQSRVDVELRKDVAALNQIILDKQEHINELQNRLDKTRSMMEAFCQHLRIDLGLFYSYSPQDAANWIDEYFRQNPAIPHLSSKQEESKWISCEERLPENSETNVLAVGGNQTSITIMRGAYLHHILEEKGRTSLIPTHWMPLPAPPSKGK